MAEPKGVKILARDRAGGSVAAEVDVDPDRYLSHLTTGAVLPARPVMLGFDDSQGSQITEGLPQLRRRGMTGTFFCMTIVLHKPDWMSRDDLRRLPTPA